MWKGGNTTDRGYGHAWRKVRQRVLRRDKGQCQHCLGQGRYVPGTEVDHIQGKAEGGSDSMDNLQLLCTPCHRAKTNGSKRAPCTLQGIPLDVNHHWNKAGGA